MPSDRPRPPTPCRLPLLAAALSGVGATAGCSVVSSAGARDGIGFLLGVLACGLAGLVGVAVRSRARRNGTVPAIATPRLPADSQEPASPPTPSLVHPCSCNLLLDKVASQIPGTVFMLVEQQGGGWEMAYASPGLAPMFGAELRSGHVRPLWEAVHALDRDRVAASFREATRKLEQWQCEFRTQPEPGNVRWLWVNALPERQEDGRRTWHGFITDVTHRKRAEQDLEESRAVLQSILAGVDLGVFLVDVLPSGDFRFVEVNPAYERLTGIAADEIRGRTPQELVPVIPAEMAACLRASLRRGASADGTVEYEEPFFVRGRLLWWLTRLTPLRDESGQVVRLVGRSLDITERKEVELRVQSLTERLQLATDAAQVGIWDFDLIQNKLVCDERLVALYGLGGSTFEGTFAAWLERVHPADRARVEQEYRDVVVDGKPYNTSFRILRPDGEERHVRARASVQRNAASLAVRVVAVHWDVTAERRAQAEIELARDQAEDLNRQLEDALERAHRLAQEAAAGTVAKSEFLANMSHEIRTPLNAIIGMSGLLLGTELDKDQKEFADTIRCSGDGLLALVNDILDYSKIESGHLELEQRGFDLRQCIEAAVDVLAGRAAEKKLDLLYSISAGVPEAISSDVLRLKQVLVNLLSNAVKFTSKGQVYLTVEAVAAQDPGRARLRFSVQDSGIGIPPDRMNRLFKTFSQVDASTTRQYGGTGLGLAISKRIVELMGGRIWVEQTSSAGSTFCFEVEAAPAPSPTRAYNQGKVAHLVGRRILILDDNPIGARVLGDMASFWGMIPVAADSVETAALKLRDQQPVDVALVDQELGSTNGLQVARELKQRGLLGDVPVILATAPGHSRLSDCADLAGTINKPVKLSALYQLLGDGLDGLVAVSEGRGDFPRAASGRRLAILLAEDNPVNQRVALLMLQRMGYDADVAANGREAVAAALRRDYDLILMDVQMPEMDGLQASMEIARRIPAGRRPRVVAMTANASVGDRERCLGAGMDEFLSKPVKADDLRRALEETPVRVAARPS